MSTLGSHAKASAIAAGSVDQSSTRLMPMLDPPRAGFTNTGRPSPRADSSTAA
jgi:hypothetical protein